MFRTGDKIKFIGDNMINIKINHLTNGNYYTIQYITDFNQKIKLSKTNDIDNKVKLKEDKIFIYPLEWFESLKFERNKKLKKICSKLEIK